MLSTKEASKNIKVEKQGSGTNMMKPDLNYKGLKGSYQLDNPLNAYILKNYQ